MKLTEHRWKKKDVQIFYKAERNSSYASNIKSTIKNSFISMLRIFTSIPEKDFTSIKLSLGHSLGEL